MTSPHYTEGGAALYRLAREAAGLARVLEASSLPEPSAARAAVLRTLQRRPLTASDVARVLGASRQGVQRLVHALVARGWLEAVPNPRHRRAPLFALTEQGRAVHARAAQAEAERLNALAQGLEPAALRQAVALLRALRERSAAAEAPLPEDRGRL